MFSPAPKHHQRLPRPSASVTQTDTEIGRGISDSQACVYLSTQQSEGEQEERTHPVDEVLEKKHPIRLGPSTCHYCAARARHKKS